MPVSANHTPQNNVAGPDALPALDPQVALFLDFDGTLVDIAAQPEAVIVPPDLVATLQRLAARLDGALAIVSGRTLRELDHFLSPLKLPTAAEHGAQQRLPNGETIRLAAPDLREATRLASELATSHAGLRVEIKPAAVALHYRHAPELEAVCLQVMLDASRTTPGVELLRGKFVFEIKPAGINKGTSIADFMKQSGFIGRQPLFAGDDVTDETGFAAMPALNGHGIKVGDGPSLAFYRCASPTALRAWLAAASQAAEQPDVAENTAVDAPDALEDLSHAADAARAEESASTPTPATAPTSDPSRP